MILLITPEVALAQDSKYSQFAPPDADVDGSELAYYGSENESSRRQFSKKNADGSHKRRGQRELSAILDGNSEQALQ